MASECVICLSEARTTVVLPCRHMCLCNDCAVVSGGIVAVVSSYHLLREYKKPILDMYQLNARYVASRSPQCYRLLRHHHQ